MRTAPLAAYLLLFAACQKAPPKDVAALVNGRPISNAELDKQYQFQFGTGGDRPSDDFKQTQRLELLRSLIDSEIMLQRAEKLGLMAVDADVDAKFNEMKAPYTQEEFAKQLQNRRLSAEDLKAQLRRDLSIQKLINKEITAHISISDSDISEFYGQNKASFNLPEPQMHIATILVTPLPDPNARNLKNSKAQNDKEAVEKMKMIEAQLKQGADFAMLAQNYSEDPNTAPNGGDLGFIQDSALEKASMELRRLVTQMKPGQVSPVIRTPEGYRLFKLISREPAGQRELTDPTVQQTIREQLMTRKDQLYKAAYYEVARNEAKVENFLAKSIAQSMGPRK
ncbi:MAG: peptidylprolyl isomerase [Bryobacteraceae bacterium]|nr:peptidylprolyl isomerase [Bryobacteraceae bacterium]